MKEITTPRTRRPYSALCLSLFAGAMGASAAVAALSLVDGGATLLDAFEEGRSVAISGAIVAFIPGAVTAWLEGKGAVRRFPWLGIGLSFVLSGAAIGGLAASIYY